MKPSPRVVRRGGAALAAVLAVLTVAAGIAAASNVASGLAQSRGSVSVPTWLYLATGGGVIGASALLSMLVTDRAIIDDYHQRSVERSLEHLRRGGSLLFGWLGVAALGAVIVVGFVGPSVGNFNVAVLLTFVGVRAGLTTVAYTVGNPWPALNPWRRIAEVLPNGYREYPPRLGAWPAVAALLVVVWLEVVAPLTASPRALAIVVLAYTGYTLAGAIVFGPETWFPRGDPIAVSFRLYGAVAPIQRTDDGFELRFPGARLSDEDLVFDLSVVAFAVALVWELTYSGFVVTSYSALFVETIAGGRASAALVYLLLLVGGFGFFLWAYWKAAERTRERAETFISQRYLALRFAPPLLAIAAGYHVAHYLGFLLSLWPSFVDALASPLSPPPNPTQLLLPPWFSYVEIAAILVGHLMAVWVAHTVSFELFPGKLQATRSQYPFVLVMVVFTMVSLWLISLPTGSPPYAPG